MVFVKRRTKIEEDFKVVLDNIIRKAVTSHEKIFSKMIVDLFKEGVLKSTNRADKIKGYCEIELVISQNLYFKEKYDYHILTLLCDRNKKHLESYDNTFRNIDYIKKDLLVAEGINGDKYRTIMSNLSVYEFWSLTYEYELMFSNITYHPYFMNLYKSDFNNLVKEIVEFNPGYVYGIVKICEHKPEAKVSYEYNNSIKAGDYKIVRISAANYKEGAELRAMYDKKEGDYVVNVVNSIVENNPLKSNIAVAMAMDISKKSKIYDYSILDLSISENGEINLFKTS